MKRRKTKIKTALPRTDPINITCGVTLSIAAGAAPKHIAAAALALAVEGRQPLQPPGIDHRKHHDGGIAGGVEANNRQEAAAADQV